MLLKNKKPLVSVVMPVFNAGDFLVEAITSILNQTYKNIELIIVNDGSTDSSKAIISYFKKRDKRVRVITNKINVGVSKSASLAISAAKGVFIARMDADDIADVKRIEKQVEFLFKNKKVVAVGGQCDLIDSEGIKIGEKHFPLKNNEIKNVIFSHVPLQQPTLMVNMNLIPENFVWYDENYSSAEELELLFKFFKFGEIANLSETVLSYRMHSHNTSLINPKKTFYLTLKTRIIAILKYGYTPSFGGIVASVLQTIFVTLAPSSVIYPTYSFLRGMKSVNMKNVKNNFSLAKV
ncbi:MAG TPA: glycosyltransferase family 2 protein [Patescibacteria group bacterium]|nr:glycosyltransferase family 2 protein [Patescibacteria group bacterium]